MKRMVVTRTMPPWFEDGHTEKFDNNRSLTQAQIDTIVAWVDAGAPKGDPKDMPPPTHSSKDGPFPSQTSYFKLPKPFSVPHRSHGVPVRDHAHRIHQRHLGSGCGGRADGSLRRAPHRGLCPQTGIELLQGPAKEEFFEAPPSKTGAKAAKDDVPSDWLVGYAPGQPPDIFEPGRPS